MGESNTDFERVGDDGDVVALGRLDVGPDVAFFLVDDPARRLGVERRRLLHQLLAVDRQVLEVGVIRVRIYEALRRHDSNCTLYTHSNTYTKFTDLLGIWVGMINLTFVWRSPKRRCYAAS